MVTVYLKDKAPVVVKDAVQASNQDFWFKVSTKSYDTVAEFKTSDVVGYMIEKEPVDGPEAN